MNDHRVYLEFSVVINYVFGKKKFDPSTKTFWLRHCSLVLLIAELPVPHRLLTPLSSYIPIAHIFPSSRKVIAHFPNIEDSSSTSSRDESYPTLSLPPFVIAHFSGRAFLPTSLPRSHRSSIH